MILRSMLAAFQFLTRIPLPGGEDMDPKTIGSSSAWFPVVGLFIGALLAAASIPLGQVFSSGVTAALLIALEMLVSGGIHMDGLMDSFDGLMGSPEREKALNIMRDSRVGAMGVIAAVMVVLIKWTFLTSILEEADSMAWTALVLMPVLGRWSMVLGLSLFPYARSEGGLGLVFAEGTGWAQLLIATVVSGLAVWFTAGVPGMLGLLGVFLFTIGMAYYVSGRLGGLTGDIYGALDELAEVASLLIMVGLSTIF